MHGPCLGEQWTRLFSVHFCHLMSALILRRNAEGEQGGSSTPNGPRKQPAQVKGDVEVVAVGR